MAHLTSGEIRQEGTWGWMRFTADYDPTLYAEGGVAYWTKPDGTVMHPRGDRVDYPPFWWARRLATDGHNIDYILSCGFTTDGTTVGGGQLSGSTSGVVWRDFSSSWGETGDLITRTLSVNSNDWHTITVNSFPVFDVPFTAQSNPEAWNYGMVGKLPTDNSISFNGDLYIDGTTNALLTFDYDCDAFTTADSPFFGFGEIAKMSLNFGYDYVTHVTNGDTLTNGYNDRFTLSLSDAYSHTGASEWGQVLNKILTVGELDNIVITARLAVPNPNNRTELWHTDEVKVMLKSNGETVSNTNIGGASTDVIDGASSITIHYSQAPSESGESDGTEPNTPEDSDSTDSGEPTTSTLNMLTQSYAISPQKLQSLGQVLWSQTFWDNIKLVNNNPIDNIVSVKMFPFTTAGTAAHIVCGNVDMGITGDKLANASMTKDFGTVTIPNKFTGEQSFLNYSPYTQAVLYLPHIGECPLDMAIVAGKTLYIKYYIDYILGTALAVVTVDNKQIITREANVGIDIPLTASNRSQLELGYIESVGQAVTQGMGGNLAQAGASLLGGALQPHHYTTVGKFSPATAICGELRPFVRIIRCRPHIPKTYGKVYGWRCATTKTLSTCKGFTVCDSVQVSGISCTEKEKNLIKQALESGVIL